MDGTAHIVLSRLQFALTTMFHIIWAATSVGLSALLVVMEGLWLKTGDDAYYHHTRFWGRLFLLDRGRLPHLDPHRYAHPDGGPIAGHADLQRLPVLGVPGQDPPGRLRRLRGVSQDGTTVGGVPAGVPAVTDKQVRPDQGL
jgi:hypothetical protein